MGARIPQDVRLNESLRQGATLSLLDDETFLKDLDSNLSSRAIAQMHGIKSKSTVNEYRAKRRAQNAVIATEAIKLAPNRDTLEDSTDGPRVLTAIRDRCLNLDDARAWIRSSGDNPDDYTLSIKSIAYGADMFSNKMSATPKHKGQAAPATIDASDLYAAIDKWVPTVAPKLTPTAQTFVVCAADLQSGKTDYGLKSTDLAKRVLNSFAEAAKIATETRFAEIILADLGDIVENINSTSSQRATNDLAITEQIRLARRLMLEGIKMLAPLTDSLVYVAVPSNHGSVRIGPKSPENHVLDDYGIEIAEQLRDICAESDKLSNVSVVIPEQSSETLAYTTSGTTLGFAHGHQAQSPDSLGKFWQGQSHGRMPLGDADIALFGHYHSFRVQQSGDARWLMVSPASDNGSSWFTNKTGERSQAGMLSFITSNREWSNLRIL